MRILYDLFIFCQLVLPANISLLNWVGPATPTGLLFWAVVAFETESDILKWKCALDCHFQSLNGRQRTN